MLTYACTRRICLRCELSC